MNDLDVMEIRERSGLTQEELAERMGVSSRTVQNWEAGGVIPGTKKKNLLLKREILADTYRIHIWNQEV